MNIENKNHEAANQFDALRYREVRATYDLESNELELDRLRHKLELLLKSDTGEMPNLESATFARVGEDKYLQEEISQKIKILEEIVAQQIDEEEKEAA